ncbi:MAG: phosphoenolpyruvate--protein phosphotransferase, partial [Phototrophicaceae bacterium]
MSEIVLQGIGGSAGFVAAPCFYYKPLDLTPPIHPPASMAEELARFLAAREKAQAELEALYTRLKTSVDENSAQIFIGHKALLLDPVFHAAVLEQIEKGAIIEVAVQHAAKDIALIFQNSGNPLLAARVADMRDVAQRLMRVLLNLQDTSLLALNTASIVIADDLTPSDTVNLNPQLAKGICLAGGGETSHAAILARTMGIPAVVGLGRAAIDTLNNVHLIALDGSSGQVIINPNPETLARYEVAQAHQNAHSERKKTLSQQPARTANGRAVHVMANIGDLASAQQAVKYGAEGIGLLRTEFLYLDRSVPPDENEQIQTYHAIFEQLGDRPIVVRTLDIGGDKPPHFMEFPQEANPFLGWRGIRVCLDHPNLFKTQLRAILRAAVGKNVSIMYPMIDELPTLDAANRLLAEVRTELNAAKIAYARNISVGVMIETPAAALTVDLLQSGCDFFSIGTNDLTQYTLACDRNNALVTRYFDPFSPSVLRLVKHTIDAAHAAGKRVGMCGELAGDPIAIPLLLGLGLDEFSMAAVSIPEAKWIISQFSDSVARVVALHILTLPTAEDIRFYL